MKSVSITYHHPRPTYQAEINTAVDGRDYKFMFDAPTPRKTVVIDVDMDTGKNPSLNAREPSKFRESIANIYLDRLSMWNKVLWYIGRIDTVLLRNTRRPADGDSLES